MRSRSVEQSWRLWEEARALIPMSTQTHSKAPREALRGVEPCFLVRGEGGRVWDVDGNEYIDLRCGLGPISLGHRFPAVEAAIFFLGQDEPFAPALANDVRWVLVVDEPAEEDLQQGKAVVLRQ